MKEEDLKLKILFFSRVAEVEPGMLGRSKKGVLCTDSVDNDMPHTNLSFDVCVYLFEVGKIYKSSISVS